MDTRRWMRVRELVELAIDLDAPARAAVLDQECGADAALRAEVESLLAQEVAEDAFEPPRASLSSVAPGDPNLGRRIGPFVIERQLGAGGMGAVYLARRADVDFEQQVALKLIKRGMDTDEVLARFRRERAVLASLQHPNVARLYDGGATDDGLPWFAMEWVDGQPLCAWCDARELGLRARVELFLRVCAAVQHAHQRLVIHRDLKPSNVLVTSGGQPKLLDFGIAKVLASDAPDATQHTLSTARPLTPAYASPEQLRGETVTTASDVYSLGVMFYELVSGSLPFSDAAELIEPRPEPRRPSTHVDAGVARLRALDSAGLRRHLAGDLDTIALTALASEAERRYPTVDALAGDLRRYLDGQPIQARPASWLYSARKLVLRNKVEVAAALAVLAALIAGLLVAYDGYLEAESARASEAEQRRLAEARAASADREAARATAVLELVHEMLGSASPHDVHHKDYTLRQLLDDFDARSGERWAADADVEASVRTTMARSYREIGLVDKAEEQLERAQALAPAAADESGAAIGLEGEWINLLHAQGRYGDAELRAEQLAAELAVNRPGERASVLTTRGDLLSHLGRYEEAEAVLREALELRGAALEDADGRAATIAALADVRAARGDLEQAERLSREALEVATRVHGAQSEPVASALNNLASLVLRRSDARAAEELYQRALETAIAVQGPDHPQLVATLNGLGRTKTMLGDYAGAEPILRRSLDLARSTLGPDHPTVAVSASNLATVIERMGGLREAAELQREVLRIRRAAFGDEHPDTARTMSNLASVVGALGDDDEAESLLVAAVAIRRKLGDEHGLSASLQNLGGVLLRRGRGSEAVTAQREALEILERLPDTTPAELATALRNLSGDLLVTGDHESAERLLRRCLDILRAELGDEHPEVVKTRANLGYVLAERGNAADGEPLLRQALAAQRAQFGDAHPDVGRTAFRLARALDALGRDDEAIEWLRFAVPTLREQLGDANQNTRGATALLELLLQRVDAARKE